MHYKRVWQKCECNNWWKRLKERAEMMFLQCFWMALTSVNEISVDQQVYNTVLAFITSSFTSFSTNRRELHISSAVDVSDVPHPASHTQTQAASCHWPHQLEFTDSCRSLTYSSTLPHQLTINKMLRHIHAESTNWSVVFIFYNIFSIWLQVLADQLICAPGPKTRDEFKRKALPVWQKKAKIYLKYMLNMCLKMKVLTFNFHIPKYISKGISGARK